MRPRCDNRDPDPSALVLAGPAHAAAAIRLSAPPPAGPALVALLCDASHRLILAMVVEGAGAVSAPQVVDLVLAVASTGGIRGIVLGVVQPRLRPLGATGESALTGLAGRCSAGGVALLDLLLVGPRSFRSARHLAAGPGEGEDGTQ